MSRYGRILELEQELDRWRWHDLSRDDEQPQEGEMVIATDGAARWMDIFHSVTNLPMSFCDGIGIHTATHWHPVLELPTEKQK